MSTAAGPEAPPSPSADLSGGPPTRVGLGPWWTQLGPIGRIALVGGVLVIGVNLLLAALDSVVGRDPGGPTGSSLATDDDGVAAWADLLRVRGVPVATLREPLAEAELDPNVTLVVVDPEDRVDVATSRALATFVARGGHLVAVGRNAAAHLAVTTGIDPGWSDGGPTEPRALAQIRETEGITALQAEGRGRYRTVDGLTPIVGAGGDVTAVQAGPVTGVADSSILWNRHLAEGDNAAFALALTGGRPVLFAEAEHGYGRSEGLGALPWRWRLAAGGAVLAALVAMWCAGQRLGPPEPPDRALAPPRRAYVDAMAAALSRSTRDGETL